MLSDEACTVDDAQSKLSMVEPVFDNDDMVEQSTMHVCSATNRLSDYTELAIADSGCTLTAIGRRQLPDYAKIEKGEVTHLNGLWFTQWFH